MNTSLTDEIGLEFLSWINAQLRLEVARRDAENLLNRQNQWKWMTRLHTAIRTSAGNFRLLQTARSSARAAPQQIISNKAPLKPPAPRRLQWRL